MRILHATSEMYPLIKTGGLADVSISLPNALAELGEDVRILLPAYRDVLAACEDFHILGMSEIKLGDTVHHVKILEINPPEAAMPVWLVDCPDLFDRPGNPYVDANGNDWPDNAERFTCFSMVVAQISLGQIDLKWRPDVVHNHDWQTGLVAAFLHDQKGAPRTIFTIHNLSYLGLFSFPEFQRLQLPAGWWSPESIEFYGNFSMLKAGLVYSDAINTVSPTYAREIMTPEFGYGMEGVLNHYHYKLSGILNGLDTKTWNPATDQHLQKNYSIKNRKSGKRANKKALLQSLDIYDADQWMKRPLFGSVGRLVEQKGIDILASVIPQLLAKHDAGFIIIGDGQQLYIDQLNLLQYQYPNQVRLYIGYSEREAHLVEAGADFFIMPSRFEPCGLNQMYSLKYGTLPIVHNVGGLADTVVNASKENIKNKKATGLVFNEANSEDLLDALERAMKLYVNKEHWSQVQKTGMQQDFAWQQSAKKYLALYRE